MEPSVQEAAHEIFKKAVSFAKHIALDSSHEWHGQRRGRSSAETFFEES